MDPISRIALGIPPQPQKRQAPVGNAPQQVVTPPNPNLLKESK